MKYIKGFDTLRAISILFVITTHLGLFNLLPENDFIRDRVWKIISGSTGVRIFYTLSGFLITTILLLEHGNFNNINFRNFFARRFLRLLPPLIILYVTVAILMKFQLIRPNFVGFTFSIFYLYNFVPNKYYSIELGHTWTLALEEQFYLIWPIVINYLKQKKGIILIIYSILVLCVLSIYLYPNLEITKHFKSNRWFIPAIAPVLIGSYFAILNYMSNSKLCAVVKGNKLMLIAAFILFMFPLYSPIIKLSFFIQSIGISMILVWILHNQTSKFTTILENKVLSYIGKISYGLYVYQGLFLTTGPSGKLWIQQFPQNIILTIITAIISYHLLEKPILSLKSKFRRSTAVIN